MSDRDTAARKGRQAALVIAGTAVFWILATLIAALHARGGRRGLASLCIGGGEATAVAVELV